VSLGCCLALLLVVVVVVVVVVRLRVWMETLRAVYPACLPQLLLLLLLLRGAGWWTAPLHCCCYPGRHPFQPLSAAHPLIPQRQPPQHCPAPLLLPTGTQKMA
jgi:hypothetical protein